LIFARLGLAACLLTVLRRRAWLLPGIAELVAGSRLFAQELLGQVVQFVLCVA
jgi:hypothetical protein